LILEAARPSRKPSAVRKFSVWTNPGFSSASKSLRFQLVVCAIDRANLVTGMSTIRASSGPHVKVGANIAVDNAALAALVENGSFV
jgi:hypothetical protein